MAQRILRGVAAQLTLGLLDADGAAADAAGALTVEVRRSDGTVVVAAGSATEHPGTGSYRRALTPAQNNELDELTATWTDAGDASTHTTAHEVVGAYYFDLAAMRASDPSLADATRYPAADLLAARQEVEEEAERICGQAFVPRFRRATVADVAGELELTDHRIRSVRSLGVGSITVDPTKISIAGRVLSGSWPSGTATVAYTYGWDAPPADLRRAALTRLRHKVNASRSGVPDRAVSFAVAEGGTYRLDTPSATRTGLPEVDAVYARYTVPRIPGMA